MSPVDPGVVAAVLAALLWGVFLFVKKWAFPGYSSAAFMTATFAVAAGWHLLATLAVGLPAGWAAHTPGEWAFVAGTVVALALGLHLLFYALGEGDVSYVAPISKTTPAFVVPLEVGFLGERLGPLELGGAALATLAVYVANYRGEGLLAPLRAATAYGPARLALASAATLGVLNVGQRVVLQGIGLPPRAWLVVKLGGAALLLAPVAARAAVPVRDDAGRLVAAGALLAAAEQFIVLAFAAVPASIASPVVATQAVVAVVLGGVVLDERQFGVRLAAAGVAVVAVSLIALA